MGLCTVPLKCLEMEFAFESKVTHQTEALANPRTPMCDAICPIAWPIALGVRRIQEANHHGDIHDGSLVENDK